MTTIAPETTESPPTSRDILRAWYAEHPGYHRCVDVARALWAEGITLGARDPSGLTHKVATFSRRITEQGELERRLVPVARLSKPVTMYGLPTVRGKRQR